MFPIVVSRDVKVKRQSKESQHKKKYDVILYPCIHVSLLNIVYVIFIHLDISMGR